jgi:hypothetical protein
MITNEQFRALSPLIRGLTPDELHACIAIANDMLSDDDPRKITLEWVRFLNAEASEWRARYGESFGPNESADRLEQMANALASYLPPETP